MKIKDLIELFEKGKRRFLIVGNEQNGVLAGLDLEGRIFAIMNGEVVNRVNAEAILRQTTKEGYLNPGGDGLWPAPEGTCLGYEYPCGKWRVPPGLTGARYIVSEEEGNCAKICAEIDLINNRGLGISTIFSRAISTKMTDGNLVVSVKESIQYIGAQSLSKDECLLAPWSLCQFDSGPGCEVVFPDVDKSAVWDMYGPSDSERFSRDGLLRTKTDGDIRYQIGMDKRVDWIGFRDPAKGLSVTRTASPLPEGQDYIDIIDAPPEDIPSGKGVRFSVYSDASDFMEIEAAGGCPETIQPGEIMSVDVKTVYSA